MGYNTAPGVVKDTPDGGSFDGQGSTTVDNALGTLISNAAGYASDAAQSAAEAAASESNASSSEINAATSASSSASSATTSADSATDAAASAVDAENSADGVEAFVTAAESSATDAATSATAASTSATNAATSASNANTSATNAATSATSADTSSASATTSSNAASNSASTAATSASSAGTSATNASNSATAAASSATNASNSASSASTSGTNAASSATTANTKAGEASTSATNAATSASNASTSATSAVTSATSASASATSASASADAALSALDNFDDRYLGQKSSSPSLDNDGNALVTGALYFDTTDNTMKVYDGTSWLSAYASLSGALLSNNNLSDLSNTISARTNLGLGTAATTAYTDYATAAQGILAENALKTADIDVNVLGYVVPGTSDNVLTSNGTSWISAPPSAGGLEYVTKTSNYTTQDKEGVLTDTSGGPFTITLPASPSTGAQVVVADSNSSWGSNSLTIARNGSTINSTAEDLVCDVSSASVQLVFNGSTWNVYLQIGANKFSFNIDGGSPDSIYLPSQNYNGGTP